MAPILPSSITPHIVTVSSPDLVELLTSTSLPPLHHIFQSYSPLPHVTTRTTTLTPVPHTSFALRFSDLEEIELACKEDEGTRSGRFIDWLGGRISRKAPAWVKDVERGHLNGATPRTPWWDEIKRCVEGDWTPSRHEGWNHPVSIIYAVSTASPNPLQAVMNLYARKIDLPIWVDPTVLRYILIIHPKGSPLTHEESLALFNAVKKQYPFQVHLLNLTLDSPPSPIPILPLPPQLPPHHDTNTQRTAPDTSDLRLTEADAQSIGKFLREFITTGMIPWMERQVLDWNDAFSTNRGLPSRFFSSTRRLLGAAAVVSSATTTASQSFSPTSPTSGSFNTPPPQQRRLAEFATFLGDFKLAISVWESLRKEGKGGEGILPLLVAPSPSLNGYAVQALAPVLVSDPSASALLRGLTHAVRWEAGVQDLLSMEGERWLAWAASSAEEPPMALLLAHAAMLSLRKGARRRAALWYVMAAHKLEKCGIKILTVTFLKEAHTIYNSPPEKSLSPSFFDAIRWPDFEPNPTATFPSIITNIEHSLARIKYTTGDTEGAARLFLGLLRRSPLVDSNETDAIIIDDFRQAFEHLVSTSLEGTWEAIEPPIQFFSAEKSKVRLGRGEQTFGQDSPDDWSALESSWRKASKKNPSTLESAMCAEVGETLWVDLFIENPLEADVRLSNLTLAFKASSKGEFQDDIAEAEILEEITLSPQEQRTIPIAVTPLVAGDLVVAQVKYLFFSILPVVEPLSIPGKRLNATVSQRHGTVYAPDTSITISVKKGSSAIDISLMDEIGAEEPTWFQGECRKLILRLQNLGAGPIDEVWMITTDNISIWIDQDSDIPSYPPPVKPSLSTIEIPSDNLLNPPDPIRLPLAKLHGRDSLAPGQSFDVTALVHVDASSLLTFRLLLIYRREGGQFFSTRFSQNIDISPLLNISSVTIPTRGADLPYLMQIEIENLSDEMHVNISQVASISSTWASVPAKRFQSLQQEYIKASLPAQQVSRFTVDLQPQDKSSQDEIRFVQERFSELLHGKVVSSVKPPSLVLTCRQLVKVAPSLERPFWQYLSALSRRRAQINILKASFPSLSENTIISLFPLYTPFSLDTLIFWSIAESKRSGFITSFSQVGIGHGALQEIVTRVSLIQGKSIYAETKRERERLLTSIRDCEWNRDTDPLIVDVKVEAQVVEHDFSKGQCSIPVTFNLHNYSPSNPIRYNLRLTPSSSASHPLLFAAKYNGQQSYDGYLSPKEQLAIKTSLRIFKPGKYSLQGWHIDVEVGEANSSLTKEGWQILSGFLQGADDIENIVLVKNVP